MPRVERADRHAFFVMDLTSLADRAAFNTKSKTCLFNSVSDGLQWRLKKTGLHGFPKGRKEHFLSDPHCRMLSGIETNPPARSGPNDTFTRTGLFSAGSVDASGGMDFLVNLACDGEVRGVDSKVT